VDSSPEPSTPRRFRLLLDQGFPNPAGFSLATVDTTVEVVSLRTFDHSLAETSTPDWAVYCHARRAGFDALVTRDLNQTEQAVEMFVLSKLQRFTIITWRRPIEDPIREWGQLLAYLPEVKKRLANDLAGRQTPQIILLPDPTLGPTNLRSATDEFAKIANRRGVSIEQARREAVIELRAWLEFARGDANEFDSELGLQPGT
jgi:hypothetical protein